MPDTFQESEYKGFPTCKIYINEYQGESKFLTLGLKKAQAVLDNIDRIRNWVQKNEVRHKTDIDNDGIPF